jgi:hypothetical protein
MALTKMTLKGWLIFGLFWAFLGLLFAGFHFWVMVAAYRSYDRSDAHYIVHTWNKVPDAWFILLFAGIALAQVMALRAVLREHQRSN